MAKIEFSDVKLRSLRLPSAGQLKYWDAKLPAFGIRVSRGGAKTFILNRDNNLITLGRFGVVKLAEAREEAKRLMAERTLGKVRPQSIAFTMALELFLAEKEKSRRPQTVDNLKARLNQHFSFKCRLAEITHQELFRKLSKIKSNAEHDHALSVAKTFFNWAYNRRYIDDNPTRGLSLHGSQSRSRVLTDDELKAIWKAADQCGQFGSIVKLLILTGQRRGEVSAIKPEYIKDNVCTFPGDLTKNHREHQFPLSPLACSLLPKNCTTSFIFPARGKSAPFNGWSKAKYQLDLLSGVKNWTLHDLRRTFATRLAEKGISPHIIERILNHVSGTISGVAAVYNRAKYLEEMRQAVNLWQKHLEQFVTR